MFERRAPGVYHNTAVVFERDGTLAGQYRKMHIPDDPGFHENSTSPRRSGLRADPDLGWRAWRIGVLGPVVSRGGAADGHGTASLLLYPTAIGWDPRTTMARKRASATPG